MEPDDNVAAGGCTVKISKGSTRCEPPEDHPEFGATLLAANLGHEPIDDLVVGVPGAVGSERGSGAVSVIYGSRRGMRVTHAQKLGQDSKCIRGDDMNGAGFGTALAIAGSTADDYSTLAVGAPIYRDVLDLSDAVTGSVNPIPRLSRRAHGHRRHPSHAPSTSTSIHSEPASATTPAVDADRLNKPRMARTTVQHPQSGEQS